MYNGKRKRRYRQIGRLIYYYCCVRYMKRKNGRWIKDDEFWDEYFREIRDEQTNPYDV